MDAGPGTPPPAPVRRPRRARRILVALAVALMLLGGLSLLRSLAARSEPAFLWLTPEQFAQATKANPLALLGYRLLNLTGPIWRGFVSLRPQINLSARLYAAGPEFQRELPLPGSPLTNAAGARAWLLSAAEARAWQEQLKTNSAATVLNASGIMTSDGMHSTLTTGPGLSSGLGLDVVPKVSSGSLRLLLSASVTDAAISTGPAGVEVRTNLAAACIAHLQNGGALVLAPATSKSAGETNLFLFILGTAVNSRGMPIKPAVRSGGN